MGHMMILVNTCTKIIGKRFSKTAFCLHSFTSSVCYTFQTLV